MMSTEVKMPKLGESAVGDVTVSRWLKREGDAIQQHEPLLEVTTDKVDTEIPAPVSGILTRIQVQAGEAAREGVCLAIIEDANSEAVEDSTAYNGYVSPVVARMVAEHRIDLSQIAGSGREGRVTKKDVEAYLESRSNVTPENPRQPILNNRLTPEGITEETALVARGEPSVRQGPPPFTTIKPERLHPVEAVPAVTDGELVGLSAMRRSIAEHMTRSKLHTAPHVTTVFEFDLSMVLAHLDAHKPDFARQGVNLTLTAYFALAVAQTLPQHPYLNAEWREDGIYLHHPVHLGIAVALDEGLIVPVIRAAQDLNLLGMARALNDVAGRARNKQLKAEEARGGTFTISNHGVGGSLLATPIINQPQVAILGVGVMEKRVKVIHDMLAIRPCCYVTLTFDHRVADGAVGDGFMLALKRRMEDWR